MKVIRARAEGNQPCPAKQSDVRNAFPGLGEAAWPRQTPQRNKQKRYVGQHVTEIRDAENHPVVSEMMVRHALPDGRQQERNQDRKDSESDHELDSPADPYHDPDRNRLSN